MGFWASGDSSNPGAGVDWSTYGKPKDAYEKEAREKALANGYYGVGDYAQKAVGGAEGVTAYMDHSDSEAFRKRLNADMASIGGRAAPTAGKTAIGSGGNYYAAKLGPTATYGGASLNLGDDAAARAQQMKAAAALKARADGTAVAPGVQQLYASLAKNNAATTAASATARAPNAGLAMRALEARKAAATQGAAGDAAILKAQDQQASQAALANLLTSSRAADMQGATTDAAFKQNASMFSADALNKAAMATAAGDQSASMFNAGVAQEQYGMDQEVALANMRAYLQSQGLNDSAIAARMGMYQDAINKEKRDEMAFWDAAAGADRFNSSMSWQQQQYDDAAAAAKYAAAGQAIGAGVGYYNSQPDAPKRYGGGDAKYDSDDKRAIVTTSDARQKTAIQPAAHPLRSWLDELGGSR